MARSKSIALFLFALLIGIAALHAYWALGGLWPALTEADLIKTVIGAPDFERMPPSWMTFTVAALLVVAGLIALSASGVVSLGWAWLARLSAGVIALIFIARGIAGYWIGFATQMERTQPFATYDLLFYSPLCLVIGAGFMLIAIAGRR